ncbi:MAG TPA: hypothetical protein VKP30_28710 [Polyangiaceae bacterium]|nr:hypothetical protein [Polyangiaceae bacterium]
MQSAVALFPKSSFDQSTSPVKGTGTPSGFFDAPPVLPASSLAAAVVLAVHRGLVAEPEREHLPLRV